MRVSALHYWHQSLAISLQTPFINQYPICYPAHNCHGISTERENHSPLRRFRSKKHLGPTNRSGVSQTSAVAEDGCHIRGNPLGLGNLYPASCTLMKSGPQKRMTNTVSAWNTARTHESSKLEPDRGRSKTLFAHECPRVQAAAKDSCEYHFRRVFRASGLVSCRNSSARLSSTRSRTPASPLGFRVVCTCCGKGLHEQRNSLEPELMTGRHERRSKHTHFRRPSPVVLAIGARRAWPQLRSQYHGRTQTCVRSTVRSTMSGSTVRPTMSGAL